MTSFLSPAKSCKIVWPDIKTSKQARKEENKTKQKPGLR
jgi:hypothetical protein